MPSATESESRRRVRETVDRAMWHYELQRSEAGLQPKRSASPDHPPETATSFHDSSWFPTVAELQWMAPDAAVATWRTAVRRAARAKFPRQTAALHSAAHLAGFLVVAGRFDEERARLHLEKAAHIAGLRPAEVERVFADGYLMGREHALGELHRGHPAGDPPGGFSAVASASATYDADNRFFIDPGGLDLGPAVLIHLGHDLERAPVGVGIPSRRDGIVHVDAVFASRAGDGWTLVRRGRIHAVSIMAQMTEFHRGLEGRLARGTLVAVDLVRTAADDKAVIETVVGGDKLTPGQRRTQGLIDTYLANDRNPTGVDLVRAAEQRGTAALDVLAPIVAPILEERGRATVATGAETL